MAHAASISGTGARRCEQTHVHRVTRLTCAGRNGSLRSLALPRYLRSSPIPSISVSATSPGCRNRPSSRPTPAVVPVKSRSPQRNSTRSLTQLISSGKDPPIVCWSTPPINNANASALVVSSAGAAQPPATSRAVKILCGSDRLADQLPARDGPERVGHGRPVAAGMDVADPFQPPHARSGRDQARLIQPGHTSAHTRRQTQIRCQTSESQLVTEDVKLPPSLATIHGGRRFGIGVGTMRAPRSFSRAS